MWLGRARSSNERLIGANKTVVIAGATREKAIQEQWDAVVIKEMNGPQDRSNTHRPHDFIPVNINFDGTEDVEVDGEVNPATIEGMPRAEYNQRLDDRSLWMHRGFSTACNRVSRHECCEDTLVSMQESHGRQNMQG